MKYTKIEVTDTDSNKIFEHTVLGSQDKINIKTFPSDLPHYMNANMMRGKCKVCFGDIDLMFGNCCGYCGRHLIGKDKKWHNLKLFIEEGIIRRTTKLIKLRFNNLRDYRKYELR